ncbi:unnamed protein product [Chrysoparadoxa australica]
MAFVSTQAQLSAADEPRWQTMTLQSHGPCVIPQDKDSHGRTILRPRTHDQHNVQDIDGAAPYNRTSHLTNKQDLYQVADIAGTSSIRLHKDTNKPDRTLYVGDIEGTKPRENKFFRTTRSVNPLEPEYSLPTYEHADPIEPRFLRDAHDPGDIQGTQSKPLFRFAQRDSMGVADIEGASAGWKPRHIRARHEAPPLDHTLNVKDITQSGFTSMRQTNPLQPSYTVNGMVVEDDPVKSRPRALPRQKAEPYRTLTTSDIEGAQCGWRPFHKTYPPLDQRRHFRNTNFIGDIPGAQPDTVQHAIRTSRVVNPLNPSYVSLDGDTLKGPATPLYKDRASIEATQQLEEAILRAETVGRSGSLREKSGMAEATNQTQDQEQEGFLRQGISTSSSSNRSRSHSRSSRTPDEKDRLIAQLEQEISYLRHSRSSCGSSAMSSHGRTEKRPSSSRARSASWKGSTPGSRSSLRGSACTSGHTQGPPTPNSLAATVPRTNRGSDLSASAAMARSDSSSGIRRGGTPLSRGGASAVSSRQAAALEIRERSGSGATERLVLRSSGGSPRVPLSVSEMRRAQEYQDDIASVRDLM